MARILYSVTGEGRGHATRARAMIELLRPRHDITVLAADDAFDMLSVAYAHSGVDVRRIPCLHHHYRSDGQLSLLRTGLCALPVFAELPHQIARVSDLIRWWQPDLAIADFDPILPRAARRCRLPFVSLDHQHVLTHCDLATLPPRLRRSARFLALFVGMFCRNQLATVISSFYFPPLRRHARRVVQVGVLLRPEVARARPSHGRHLVAYLRRTIPDRALRVLASLDREVRVYGLGVRPPANGLSFHAISEAGFVADLASASALVTTAGNQVVGEAMALGKPVFALPEPGNLEQAINAHFAAATGAGEQCAFPDLSTERLEAFLGRVATYSERLASLPVAGNAAALAVVESALAAVGRTRTGQTATPDRTVTMVPLGAAH